ncbi:MAG: hypothetical protein PT953_04150, partial [Prevotella sp.]|nr:hypothetical protein [Prevotella sp.]
GSMYLGGSMPRRADTRVAMQDKVNVTDYNSLSFRWAVVGLCADATPSITVNVRQMSGRFICCLE